MPPVWLQARPPATFKIADFSSILGDTFRVFLKRPLSFFLPYFLLSFGFASAFLLAAMGTDIATFLFGGAPLDPTRVPLAAIGPFLLRLIPLFVAFAVVSVIVGGGVTHCAVLLHRATPARVGGSLLLGVKRTVSLLGAALLTAVILLGLFLIAFAPLVLGALSGDVGLVVTGLIAVFIAIPVAIFLAVALSLYPPAIMVEGVRAIEGLRRSWDLTRGHRLSLFGVYVVIGLIVAAISLAAFLLPALLGDPIVTLIAQAVASGVVSSWSIIAAAVAYDLIVSHPGSAGWYSASAWPSPAAPTGPSGG